MSNNQALKLVKKTLRHMDAMQSGHQVGGILLAGDPGIGKTTFVAMLGKLLGMKTIVIEVPHITEEHLINIPFIVFNPQGGRESGTTQVDQEYKLVLAQSNLFTQMTSASFMSDENYLNYIKTAPAHVKSLYQALGGTDEKIPPAIAEARQNHKAILFLDEYYRQASTRIRNIMRGILNGNIGMHKIPKDVYVLYASNMRDGGVESIPSNHQFNVIEYKAPTKDAWFEYLVSTYENDANVKVNHTVMNKFKAILDDSDLSHSDMAAEVRTSPRRWEQLIMYVNNAIPVESREEARALITNVRNNFIHYQTEIHSNLAAKVTEAVADLIRETTPDIPATGGDSLEPHEWRSALQHAVDAQIKAGGTRKHIPVVSGPPGIGKTSQAAAVARKHNLRLIELDVGELYAEDAIGMPIPGERDGEKISVKFSVPKLFHQIHTIIRAKDAAYETALKEEYGAEEGAKKFADYEKQRWKYLIFFDELNRVDEKTFNALRKVILEKNFGPSGDKDGSLLELPKEAVVVAAINPEGVGTAELTQHFRDVIDIIPAKASWDATKTWLMAKNFKNIGQEVKDSSMNIIQSFIDKFKTDSKQVGKQQQPFYLDLGGAELYIAPREYADMFATMVREVGAVVRDFAGADDDIDELRDEVDEAVADALEDSLNMIFYKHEVDKDEFIIQLRNWIRTLPDTVYKGLMTRVAGDSSDTLSKAMKRYLDGHDLTKLPDDSMFVNLNNTLNNAQFISELKDAIVSTFSSEKSIKEHIIDQSHRLIGLKDDELVYMNVKASLLENFMVAILYSLHIHNYSNDRIIQAGRAMSQAMSEIRSRLKANGTLSDDLAHEASIAAVGIRSRLVNTEAALT